ncbi:MAG TPA: hypothetical protein V6D07_10880 [Trichocoleus sp.]
MTDTPWAASFLQNLQTLLKTLQPSIIGMTVGGSLLSGGLAWAVPASAQTSPLAEGQYLYGETAQANVLGSTYILFEIRQNRIVGAFYQPSSSFDCFHGSVANNKLNLAVVDSYDQTSHPYDLALTTDQSPIAATQGIAVPAQIEGFQPIATLSANDQAILNTCLANHPL